MSLRSLLADAFLDVVRSTDLAALVRAALPVRSPRGSIRAFAVGKAAPEMARGLLAAWGPSVGRVLVIAPEGVPCRLEGLPVELLVAAHPLPDARSEAAARRLLAFVRRPRGGLVVGLISGGSSALLCAPYRMALERKRAVVEALLHSGASITEMNVVRRHLSTVKGGAVTRAAAPARVLSLLLSDVIDGAPWDIGSGPTLCDPTTVGDARGALERYASEFASIPLVESLKPHEPASRRQRWRVLSSPHHFAGAVAQALGARGLAVRLLSPSTADVQALAADYARIAAGLRPGDAVVRAAEPSVRVERGAVGRGGRCAHLAALLAPQLPADAAFLAGASDGVDGTSGAAGAVVDATTARALAPADYARALAAFDSAAVHDAAGTALRPGPTGLNFADVHALARRG